MRIVWEKPLFAVLILMLFFSVYCHSEKITIATEEFPPYVTKSEEADGWAALVAVKAFEAVGEDVEIKLVSWSRAYEYAKMGHYDGLYLAYRIKERENYFYFSEPIGYTVAGFYKRKGSAISYENLQDLKGYRIGLTKNASVAEEFDQADYLTKITVTDHHPNIKNLMAGRLDLIAGNRDVIRYFLKKNYPEDYQKELVFIDPPLAKHGLHLAFSKKIPESRERMLQFNEGLKIIRENGEYQKILNRYGYKNSF